MDLYVTFLDFEKAFDRVCGEECCLVGFKETRCGRVIGKNCTVNVWNDQSLVRVNDFFSLMGFWSQ